MMANLQKTFGDKEVLRELVRSCCLQKKRIIERETRRDEDSEGLLDHDLDLVIFVGIAKKKRPKKPSCV